MENKNITWFAPEFRHYAKNIGWYVTLIAISVMVVGFFIIEGDFFAAITTAILAGFIIFFAGQQPETVKVELTHKSLHFGNIVYPYKQLKYFWVVSTPHHKTVNFMGSTYVNNTIIIELEDQDPDEIREFLLTYIPEHHDIHPTFAQKVTHKLKF